MPQYDFDIQLLLRELEDETYLSEALLFPEICRFADRQKRAEENALNSLPALLSELHPGELAGRRAPLNGRTESIELAFEGPKRSPAWNQPYRLTFHYYRWSQQSTYHAFVPALTIEVVAESEAELEELLPGNIESELHRRGHRQQLGQLMWYAREQKLHQQTARVGLDFKTPLERAKEAQDTPEKPGVLKEVATDLTAATLPRAFELEAQLERLARLLTGEHARSVLLVGPSGVGKTALLYQLVGERARYQLGSTPFFETTGARLMVGADAFGEWQERCRALLTELSHQRAIVFLGNLFELAEVGRSGSSPEGIAGFFRPYFERGDMLAVVECTPEQRDLLQRDQSHLLEAFQTLEIPACTQQQARRVLRRVAPARVENEAIELVERLHRRFATYSAYPGRPLRFLRDLVTECKAEVGPSQVARSFAEETGLPQFMIDDRLPLELTSVERFFSSRILGQQRAVAQVVDLLATVKAGLSPPGRPIASLLLIGPTGVGKTEMARCLAQFLFSDRKRMVRFDMSEFSDPWAVERLVGGRGDGQGLLTAAVREQPFGLVLLDELEKADPSFFDLLLQILGEGRLTDEAGRLADFTNSLVVMTSNLGAANFQKGPLGFRNAEVDAGAEFMRAVKAAFRPELFNRIDRLIPFEPLTPEQVGAIAERELQALLERDGVAHGNLQLTFAPEVATLLSQQGYDRRYGARPLKRQLERTLLAPLAAEVNRRRGGARQADTLKVEVTVSDGEIQLAAEQSGKLDLHTQARQGRAQLAMRQRRQSERMLASPPAEDLRNRCQRLGRLRQRQQRGKYLSTADQLRLAELAGFEALLEQLKALEQQARAHETEAVLALAGHLQESQALNLEEEIKTLALKLYALRFENPRKATVIVYPGKGAREVAERLLSAYRDLALQRDCEVTSWLLEVEAKQDPPPEDGRLRLKFTDELEVCCSPCQLPRLSSGVGAVLEIEGPLAAPLFATEAGQHHFVSGKPKAVEVVVEFAPLKDYTVPEEVHRRQSFQSEKRRTYRATEVEDSGPRKVRTLWTGKNLDELLSRLIPEALEDFAAQACNLIEPESP